jgi:DNA-directed RNA polymerase subunit M/transcription elongation factor TFIIS
MLFIRNVNCRTKSTSTGKIVYEQKQTINNLVSSLKHQTQLKQAKIEKEVPEKKGREWTKGVSFYKQQQQSATHHCFYQSLS